MQDQNPTNKIDAAEALAFLELAWAYYTPEPAPADESLREPDLFEYANAA